MVQHLALPLRVTDSGRLAAVDQDSPTEIAQSVALLLSTAPGERRSVPEYGLVELLAAGYTPDDLADAIAEWETRADPALVEQAGVEVQQQLDVIAAPPPTDAEEA